VTKDVDNRLHHVLSAHGGKVKLRPLEWTLLAIVVIGGGLAWQSGWERARLTRDRDRLAQITGDLTIADPTKLHIQALEKTAPLDFAWRIYLPPNFQLIRSASTGGSGSSSSSGAHEFVARVRFRVDEKGLLQVFARFSGGHSVAGLGDERLADLLHDRWGAIRVEQLGAKEGVAMSKGESAVLLRLSLPDAMQAEARQKLTPADRDRFVPTLYELKLGPDPPQRNPAQSGR
jgi:hypothetical protein